MKKHNKALICAFSAALAILAAAPLAAQADELDEIVISGGETAEVLGADAKTEEAPAEEVSSGENAGAPLTPAVGWTKNGAGEIFYVGADGAYFTGVQNIDGEDYLFSENGVLKTGWRTVNGKRKYFEPESGKPVYGRFEYCGKTYLIEKENGKKTGKLKNSDGSFCLYDENGILYDKSGFVRYGDNAYYVKPDNTLAVGSVTIDGFPHLFGDEGEAQTGWKNLNGKSYYFYPETGEAAKYVAPIEGSCYFIDPEKGRIKGEVSYGGDKYYFGSDYKMCTGIVDIGGKKYYYSYDGKQVKGAVTYNGRLYYFDDSTGEMLTGRRIINGRKYYIRDDGTVAVGWLKLDDSQYYFDTNGAMHTGWLRLGSERYYFDPDSGKLQTGRQMIDSAKYIFDSTGKMLTGWQGIDGGWYYFDPADGKMQTGRLVLDGKKYFLDPNGKMQTGWQYLDNAWYYFDNSGVMKTGWATIEGSTYYFDTKTGQMAANTMLSGYNIESDGKAYPFSSVQNRAVKILSTIEKKPDAIYDHVCAHNEYKSMSNTKKYSEIKSSDWAQFANYAMDNKGVVGYYFAAVTDLLFKQAGYQSRIVYGTGRGTSEHYWNQVYVNGKWLNYDACNGFAGVTDEYLKTPSKQTGAGYKFKEYLTPKYY